MFELWWLYGEEDSDTYVAHVGRAESEDELTELAARLVATEHKFSFPAGHGRAVLPASVGDFVIVDGDGEPVQRMSALELVSDLAESAACVAAGVAIGEWLSA